MSDPVHPSRPRPLAVAAVLTAVCALACLGVAVAVVFQMHGGFSGGIGLMLGLYGALLGWIAWTTWRQRFYLRGILVGSALLNLCVAVSSWSSNVALWTPVAVVTVVIVVCAVLPSAGRRDTAGS